MRNISIVSFLFLVAISGLTSCKSGMNSVSMQVMKPAPIFIPNHIQKVAVVNRTLASKENKTLGIIESVITGEGIYADREGAEDCLLGLRESLTRTNRFSVYQPAGLNLKGTGTGVLASPMTWEDIQRICTENSVDAVIALDAFDSDSRIDLSSGPVNTKDAKGNPITITEHNAYLKMNVTTGWSVYDPKERRVIDEFRSVDDLGFNSKGANAIVATAGLPAKRDAAKKTGYRAGQLYGNRISPSWITVSRGYYSKINDNFKLAKKKVQYKDWDGAAEIWKKEALNPDKKIAGMACYNMAVAAEVNGNLDAAMEWATKSYKQFENFKGASYMSILQGRINDVQRLNDQMSK